MKTSDFDHFLHPKLIAQTPIELKDQAPLMVLNRSDSSLKHHRFFEIVDYLRAGDVLPFNAIRVKLMFLIKPTLVLASKRRSLR